MDWGSAFTTGTCRQFYDCIGFIASLGTDVVDDHLLGCTSPTVLQSMVSTNRSFCGDLFSVLALAPYGSLPFLQLLNWGWLWDACRQVVLELRHFAHQWPFFPQPLHAESWAGQLCLLGGCWWVQLGHSAYDVCGLESCAWWVWHTACTTCPKHIAAAPDSTA